MASPCPETDVADCFSHDDVVWSQSPALRPQKDCTTKKEHRTKSFPFNLLPSKAEPGRNKEDAESIFFTEKAMELLRKYPVPDIHEQSRRDLRGEVEKAESDLRSQPGMQSDKAELEKVKIDLQKAKQRIKDLETELQSERSNGGTCRRKECISTREELQKKVKGLKEDKIRAENEQEKLKRDLLSMQGEFGRERMELEKRINQICGENNQLKALLRENDSELKKEILSQKSGMQRVEENTRQTKVEVKDMRRELTSATANMRELEQQLKNALANMSKTRDLEQQLKETQQQKSAYANRNSELGKDIQRLRDQLQKEQNSIASLRRQVNEQSQALRDEQHKNSKRCTRQASECDKVHRKFDKKETMKVEKERIEELERLKASIKSLEEKNQNLEYMLESPECHKPHCVQLQQKIKEQQKAIQMASPMKNMSRQYDGEHDQLKKEYDELMTSPDGILGQLEKEFADPFDAKVVLTGIFMTAYRESKNSMMRFVFENLKELFNIQTEPDEERESSSQIDMDDLSRAFGLLLHSTAARSRLTRITFIPTICEKVERKLPEIEPIKRQQKQIPQLPLKQVVELTLKFVTLPNPMILCQPKTFREDIHSKEFEHWDPKLAEPYQLIYARPVLYRSYHGVLACKGLVGNLVGSSVDL